MITKENIEELLPVLKFTKDLSGTFWRRDFPIGCTLEVDVNGEKFYYEKAGITVMGATTANFSQNENFVVFECICRILEKGYRPKDIELEPTWRLGRTGKGGRADIWIRTKGKRDESGHGFRPNSQTGYTAKVWSDCMISSWYRFDTDWSRPIPEIDRQLYAKSGLTEAEQKFIESMIKPME